MIKFNGRKYNTGRKFHSVEATNSFLEKNSEYGVLGEAYTNSIFKEKAYTVYVAKCSDLGRLF